MSSATARGSVLSADTGFTAVCIVSETAIATAHTDCIVVGTSWTPDRSSAHYIRLWGLAPPSEKTTLIGHTALISGLTMFGENTLASGSYDHTVRVWDLRTHSTTRVLGCGAEVNCVRAVAEDTLAAGTADNAVHVWNVLSGERLHLLRQHHNYLWCACALSNGLFATGAADNVIRVWDATEGRQLYTLTGHKDCVSSLCLLQDGTLASGCDDHSIRIWDMEKRRTRRQLHGHTGWVMSLCEPLPMLLVSGSSDSTVRTWDLFTGQCLRILDAHTSYVWCVRSLGCGRVITALADRTARIWEVSDLDPARALSTPSGSAPLLLGAAGSGATFSGAGGSGSCGAAAGGAAARLSEASGVGAGIGSPRDGAEDLSSGAVSAIAGSACFGVSASADHGLQLDPARPTRALVLDLMRAVQQLHRDLLQVRQQQAEQAALLRLHKTCMRGAFANMRTTTDTHEQRLAAMDERVSAILTACTHAAAVACDGGVGCEGASADDAATDIQEK